MSNDDKSLSHTRWNCKYHIVFTPKYRRKVIYGKLRKDIGRILRRLCEMKEVEITSILMDSCDLLIFFTIGSSLKDSKVCPVCVVIFCPLSDEF